MAESIVRVPSTAMRDFDFLGFSFNGKHSYDDFGIYRVSNGMLEDKLVPSVNDKTAEVPNGDGMYYFNTIYKQRDFQISFAFDHLTEEQLRGMRQWLNGKEMGDLWFEEAPYKVYTAKVTGQPSIKVIPFDETYTEGGVQKTRRIYKGEGNITFTAYWPYAHTPDLVKTSNSYDGGLFYITPGKWYNSRPFEAQYIRIYFKEKNAIMTTYLSGTLYLNNDEEQSYTSKETNAAFMDAFFTVKNGNLNRKIESFKFKPDETLEEGQIYIKYTTKANDGVPNLIMENPIDERGISLSPYQNFSNWEEWSKTSGLKNDPQEGDNPGDIPAPFIMKAPSTINQPTLSTLTFKVGDLAITVSAESSTKQEDGSYTHYTKIEWDSKTGIVSAEISGVRKPIRYTGTSLGGIPVGGLSSSDIAIQGGTLKYHYWYY